MRHKSLLKAALGLVLVAVSGLSFAADGTWQDPAPKMPAKTVALSAAISTLVPASSIEQPARLEGVSPSLQVSWKAGQSRQAAFNQMLKKYGLYATGDAETLTISTSKLAAQKNKTTLVSVKAETWTIQKGQSIDRTLQQWAAKSGWTVLWQLPHDWNCPHATVFKGDFVSAVSQVVAALAENGVDAHVKFRSNEVALISSSGSNPLSHP